MQREQLGAAHADGSSSGRSVSAQETLGLRLAADQLVAFGAPGDRTGGELRRDVSAVAQALPEAAPGSQVLIVIRADRYALLVGLLAVWRRGFVAAFPPEHDREAITALATQSVTVLHDTASGAALRIAPLLAAAEAGQATTDDAGWADLTCAGRLYQRAADGSLQSASSDEAWLQRAQQLAQRLELRSGQRCATSVGMGHPHGVLLGIVAPWLAGSAFLRARLEGAELSRALASEHVDLVVSVPAQLTGLLEGGTPSAGQPQRVVSAALEPLSRELRERAGPRLGAHIEDRSDLVAEIPLLCASEPSAERSGADEALLALVRAAPGVRDAAVVALEGRDRPSRCVAVMGPVPGEESSFPLDLARLRAAVAQQDARAELLEVREIRRDALGRFQRAALLRQFRRRADGRPLDSTLCWSEATSSEANAVVEHRASAQIPDDYPYFDGHFPGYPILPGAAQLSELIVPLVRRVRPELGRLRAMARLKFSGRIQPGETIDVVLQGRPGDGQLDFTLRRGKTLCAAGSLSFAPGDEPSP